MFVDTVPPVQEPRGKTDADSYAYAASTTSFITVLDKVNTLEAKEADTNSPSRNIVGNDTDANEAAALEKSEGVVEESATAPDETISEHNETPPSTRSETDSADNIDPTEEAPLLEEYLAEGLGENLEIANDSSSERVSVEENVASSPRILGEGIAPSETAVVPSKNSSPEEHLASLSSALTQGAAVGEAVSTTAPTDGDEASPNTGQSSTPSFPKNLNALLAENAVKPQNADGPASPLSETSTATTEKSSELDGMPDTPSPALPQMSATELGGIRTTTPASIPRVPLSNLPGEIAQQIHLIQQQGTSTIRLRLSPENLGELRLEVQHTGNTVRVTLISASPQVRDALDSQMTVLRQALAKQGLNLAESFIGNSPSPGGNGGSAPEPRKGTPSSIDMAPMETRILKSNPQQQAATTHATNGLNVLA